MFPSTLYWSLFVFLKDLAYSMTENLYLSIGDVTPGELHQLHAVKSASLAMEEDRRRRIRGEHRVITFKTTYM